MKENKQIYVDKENNNTILISHVKNTYYNFEPYNYPYNYFISRDLKKECEGYFLSGCFLNLYQMLDLKEFNVEISEIG